MKLHFVLFAFMSIYIIEIGTRRPKEKATAKRYDSYSGLNRIKEKEFDSSLPESDLSNEIEPRGIIGGVTNKVKQAVVLVQCVIKCFVKYLLRLKICNRMFPCLYDCSIGQKYIEPEVQSEMEKIGGSGYTWPQAITLDFIYKQLKCVNRCLTDTKIRNWETFVSMLYCFAETCVCYNIFGSG